MNIFDYNDIHFQKLCSFSLFTIKFLKNARNRPSLQLEIYTKKYINQLCHYSTPISSINMTQKHQYIKF